MNSIETLVAFSFGLSLASSTASLPALAQASTTFCIKQHQDKVANGGNALGIAPADAELLIGRVADSISLNIVGLTIVPCDQAAKAESTYSDGSVPGVRAGEYILYDPLWLREVIGGDKTQAIAIFGHELGHLLNRDFHKPRSLLPRIRLETDADEFAGCAVARSSGDWQRLENLLLRIRGDVDTSYPSAKHSIAAARRGFMRCGDRLPAPQAGPSNLDGVSQGLARVLDMSFVKLGSEFSAKPEAFKDQVHLNDVVLNGDYTRYQYLLPGNTQIAVYAYVDYKNTLRRIEIRNTQASERKTLRSLYQRLLHSWGDNSPLSYVDKKSTENLDGWPDWYVDVTVMSDQPKALPGVQYSYYFDRRLKQRRDGKPCTCRPEYREYVFISAPP